MCRRSPGWKQAQINDPGTRMREESKQKLGKTALFQLAECNQQAPEMGGEEDIQGQVTKRHSATLSEPQPVDSGA